MFTVVDTLGRSVDQFSICQDLLNVALSFVFGVLVKLDATMLALFYL